MTDQLTTQIKFAGQYMQLDARRALWWQAQEMLIVSDLHFGKGSFLARHGSALPAHDTHDTLERLAVLIDHYRPQQLVCLGDSFHDVRAYKGLHQDDHRQLIALIRRVPLWHWILGNHDPLIEDDLPGQFHEILYTDNILLTHEPAPDDVPQMIGHYHPKANTRVGGRRVSGPCFMITEHKLIMPAFGSYTGGLDCADPAITAILQGTPECRFIYNNKLWKL